jgi:hypothetical protein
MVAVNSKGEVVSVNEADQFQLAKTQFACGYFACAIARSMVRPGETPTLNVAQVIADAEKWDAQYDGSDAASNTEGMTNEQEYELLGQIGLHYQAIAADINQVKAWVSAGYPVLIAVQEASVHDQNLDGANPYPWTPTGTHIILVTGVGSAGNILVRDSANVTSLYNPASLRPGPRLYNASKIQLVSATVVVPPWRPRPESETAIPVADMQIPDGWQDDQPSGTLTAPNGVKVTGVFRLFILSSAWPAADVPMGPEETANPVEFGFSQSGGNNEGTRQIFMYSELCRTSARPIYRASIGREFWTLLNEHPAAAPATQPKAPSDQASATINDIKAAAKLIGDTGEHIIAQADALLGQLI